MLIVISAKRYTFFRLKEDQHIELIEPSEHGLGHLLNPYTAEDEEEDDQASSRRWIKEVWDWIVRGALGMPREPLQFASLPAVTRIAVTTPHVMKTLTNGVWLEASDNQIRPATFLLSVSVAHLGHPGGANVQRFHLVSPMSSDPNCWIKGPWADIYSGKEIEVTTDPSFTDPSAARVKTFENVILEYESHPEPKSADATGKVCDRQTRGPLHRRHVSPSKIDLTGKESNRLEDVRKGLIHDPNEIATTFSDPAYSHWELVEQPRLATFATSIIAKAGGISERAARRLKAGTALPSSKTRSRLRARLKI